MKRITLFNKLFLGNLLLVSGILFVGAWAAFGYLDHKFQADNLSTQTHALDVSQRYFQALWPKAASQIDDECKSLWGDSPLRLTVIAKDGQVLGDSKAAPDKMENHDTKDRPEILAALRGEFGKAERHSGTLDIPFRYFAKPITHNGVIVGVVRVAMPVQTLAEGSNFIRNVLALTVLIVLLVGLCLGLILNWVWYFPLRQIVRAARSIASGALDQRVAIAGSGELAQLSGALNDMRHSLSGQIQEIEFQKTNLQTVLENLTEGIVALNAAEQIVLVNPAARNLFDLQEKDIHGQVFQELIRVPDAIELLHGEDKTVRRCVADVETSRGTRHYVFTAVGLDVPSQDSIQKLLVIRDMTEQARMTALKSQFVANASHELRTPLATIRAAVDSLLAVGPNDPEAFDKFLVILDRHTRRLESMTTDLLDLHILEGSKSNVQKGELQVDGICHWIHESFDLQAQQEGLQFEVVSDCPDTRFVADRALVQLILQNLIDNAIKFTPEGGRVECRFFQSETGLAISVSDTGCGISEENQQRVFERFFQADDSRTVTPKTKGTGLGLAIVKHAAERLGAEIQITSELGQGTTIYIHFLNAAQ